MSLSGGLTAGLVAGLTSRAMGGVTGFRPASVPGAVFVSDPSDATLYQNDNGTTAATADANRIRYLTNAVGSNPATSATLTRAWRLGSRFGTAPAVWYDYANIDLGGLTSAATVAPNSFTLVMRLRPAYVYNFSTLFITGVLAVRTNLTQGDKLLSIRESGSGRGSVSFPVNTDCVLSVVSDATSIRIYTNGTLRETVSASGNSTPGSFLLGSFNGQWPYIGQMGRVFVGSSAVSDANRVLLEAWAGTGSSAGLYSDTLPWVGVCGSSSSAGFGGPVWSAIVADNLTNRVQWANTATPGDTVFGSAAKMPGSFHSAGRALEAICLWAGTNDIQSGSTGAAVWANTQSACQYLTNAGMFGSGLKLIVGDCMARGTFNATQQGYRNDLNASFAAACPTATAQSCIYTTANGLPTADGILYVYRTSEEPNLQDPFNTTYFNADTVHLTAAGQTIIAAGFQRALGLVGVT